MDGKVLLELFTPQFRETHSVTFSDDDEFRQDGKKSSLPPEEEAELMTILREQSYVT